MIRQQFKASGSILITYIERKNLLCKNTKYIFSKAKDMYWQKTIPITKQHKFWKEAT